MLSATLGTGMPSQTARCAPFFTALASRSSTTALSAITHHQTAGTIHGITGRAAIAIAALVPSRIGMLRADARNRRDAAAISACAEASSPRVRGDSVMPDRPPPRAENLMSGCDHMVSGKTLFGSRFL